MDGTRRADIKPGTEVKIVLKQDQRTGKLTHGFVKNILTSPPPIPTASKYGWKMARWVE